MKEFRLINLFIYLNGLLIFNFLPFFSTKIFAKDVKKNLTEKINSAQLELVGIKESIDISTGIFASNNEVIEDLKSNGDALLNLLAFGQKNFEDDFFVEIDADIQYRDKEVFFAEGNAIIYLSDATLSGDLVKYDLQNKILTVVGNVIFKKGEQYFTASELTYNVKEDTGYINDVYGLLDSKTFADDFKLELNKKEKKFQKAEEIDGINQPKYVNTARLGLVNDFEENKNFNITKAELEVPQITRWRYKTNKLIYNSKTLESKEIYFTNDIYNKPQFLFLSKNFSAEIIDNKLKLLSKKSWIILDDKLKIPVGRRSVFDRDPLTKWGFGADYQDKDGYYLFRGLSPRKVFRDYSLQVQPYFLIQRALKGSTNAYTSKNASVFSSKEKSDISFADYFAVDLNLKGKEKNWDIESKIQLNSLDTSRLNESLRTKLTLSKKIDLNNNQKYAEDISSDNALNDSKDIETNLKNDKVLKNFIDIDETNYKKSISQEVDDLNIFPEKNEETFTNFLDMQIYNVFREKVVKDFATEEIYFATGFNISNKKAWSKNNKKSNITLIYDVGQFKSKSRTAKEFKELFRNSFVGQYGYQFPLWTKSDLDKTIDKTYKYRPEVISQALYWSTGIKPGLFVYSNGSNQSFLKFKTGPVLTIGGFKKKFFDYTKISTNYQYTMKGGESPFSFDDINNNPRINFEFQQQIYGALLFKFDTTLNLNSGSYSNVKYALDFNRRAYSIGAFYNSSNESIGVRFNIFNFDYSGLSDKF